MRIRMKYLLFSLLFLLSLPALAAECFVVSGAGKDDNGAFSKRKILNPSTSIVNGKKCKVVGGLAALKVAVKAANLKLNSDVLIVFGAHGFEDNGVVKFEFNSDQPNANEVYSYLRTLAKSHQVGSILHACQSGEVMHKLIQEENDPLAGKLCLITSSSRGRMSFSSPLDPMNLLESVGKPNAPKNLEQLYLKTPAGMISSAAWEETGVAKYYRTKDVSQSVVAGFEALKEMDQFVRAPGACETPAQINSALCMAPGVSDTIYKDLMHFSDPYISKNDKLLTLNVYSITAGMMEGNGKICYKGIAKFYMDRKDSIHTWGDLEAALVEMKKDTKLIAACEAFKKESPDPAVKKSIYTGDMQEGLEAYRASLARLQKVYSKTDWSNFNLKKFAQNASGDKRVCSPESKKETIQSIFGDKFFKEEMYSDDTLNYNGPAETAYGRKIHTQHMMKAFQNASVDKPEMSNAIDAKRRKACRDFKL